MYLWLQQRRDEGRTAPKPAPRGGPAPVIRGAVADALGRLVDADDALTLAECARALEAEAGVRAAPSMLCRALQRLNLPRKKDPARGRAGYGRGRAGAGRVAARDPRRRETLAGISPERLAFIDESAALTNLVRSHGRSPRGQRAHGRAPRGKWHRLTVIGALGAEGIVGAMGVEAATSGAVFAAFLERVLLPELRAGPSPPR